MNTTTITIERTVKKQLDDFKLHRNESYSDVVARLLSERHGADDPSIDWKETAEILSDPDAMRSIARGIEDMKAGRLRAVEEA